MRKNAQLSVPFHWIYVLLAGAVILIFFIGLVARQKAVSSRELSVTVSQKLDTIFAGASVSGQTTANIETPEIDFYFTCDQDGVSEYRVGETGFPHSISARPVFAPAKIRASNLVTWTLDFSMPYTSTYFLMVGSPEITTLVIYDDASAAVSESVRLKDEIMSDVSSVLGFQAMSKADYNNGIIPEFTGYVRIIFLGTSAFLPPASPLHELEDEKVSAVRVTLDKTSVAFYQKNGNELKLKGEAAIIPGINPTEKNPAFYAALFSEDDVSYYCNMRKAFARMKILADLFKNRVEAIKSGYPVGVCSTFMDPGLFEDLAESIAGCESGFDKSCFQEVYETSLILSERNNALQNNLCAVLY